MKFFSSVLLAVLGSASQVAGEKRLVLFAGPHKAAASSVEEFFYKYADTFNRHSDNHKEIFGLRFWRWPRIEGTISKSAEPNEPHKIFKHLVTDADNISLQNEILEGIMSAWQETSTGVILGTEEFDQVGPYAKYDAIQAMKSVINYLEAKDVTIVINYRKPRVDQWASIWKHEASKSSYEEFLCDKKYYENRIELLETQMNPLAAAKAFLEAGLGKVVLIDMEGVEKAGVDVAHVIACEVVDGKCDDGWLRNHGDEVLDSNTGDREFTGLSDEEYDLANALFKFRDCMFESYLSENPNFQVLHGTNEEVWQDCDKNLKDAYNAMVDPSIIFKALLDQAKCKVKGDMKNGMVSIQKVLDGEFNARKGIPGAKTPSGKGGGLFSEAILFPLILIGALSYQVFLMFNSSHGRQGVVAPSDTQGAVREAEMSAVMEPMPDSAVDAEYGDLDEDDADDGMRIS